MQGNLGPYGHKQVEYSNVIRILILRIFFRLRKESCIHNTDDPSVNFNRCIRYFWQENNHIPGDEHVIYFLSILAAAIRRANPLLEHRSVSKCRGQWDPYGES